MQHVISSFAYRDHIVGSRISHKCHIHNPNDISIEAFAADCCMVALVCDCKGSVYFIYPCRLRHVQNTR